MARTGLSSFGVDQADQLRGGNVSLGKVPQLAGLPHDRSVAISIKRIGNGKRGNADKETGKAELDPEERFYAGHFVDVRTLGLALFKDDARNARKSRSLWRLGEVFGAKPIAGQATHREGQLKPGDLDVALNQLEATLSLYKAELRELSKHGLSVMPDQIYSGASLGKADLRAMGITAPPLLDTSLVPYSPDEVLGFAMCAYHPGRSEAHIVNATLPVTLLDAHGMYPAVCILQGLFSLMRAERIQVLDATAETIVFLNEVRTEDSLAPGDLEPIERHLPCRARG